MEGRKKNGNSESAIISSGFLARKGAKESGMTMGSGPPHFGAGKLLDFKNGFEEVWGSREIQATSTAGPFFQGM